MDRLGTIGFYTLSDERARTASSTSDLQRCELILTSQCNFKCPYCRGVGGDDMSLETAIAIVDKWANHGLKNIRFSGGEPTIWPGLVSLVAHAKYRGIERIALSTNGSAQESTYAALIKAGVNDFSVSLDACCAEDGDKMSGGVRGAWALVVSNIKYLSTRSYTTVGVVLTDDNADRTEEIVKFADDLGVTDIRVIPAAQCGTRLPNIEADEDLLSRHPILRYRIDNLKTGKAVRGLREDCSGRCPLVLDDMAVMGTDHYPCIIYMREGGQPIGTMKESIERIRERRRQWMVDVDVRKDPICSANCLDVCVDYNRRWKELHTR